MDQLVVHLDRKVYSHSVAIRTAHRYSDRFSIEIAVTDSAWILQVSSGEDEVLPDDLEMQLRRASVDEVLREHIRQQTGGLQETLIKAALAGAKPIGDEDEP
jgi:His-Xaa-Ser system protein HxsD